MSRLSNLGDPNPPDKRDRPSAKPIVVIGSANMDLVCRTARMPAPGETVLGGDLVTVPGGKGANQAVAAAKLGADVHLIARVGDDDFGAHLLTCLQAHKVNTTHVTVTEGVSSGCAMILVDSQGENSIVVSPGANARFSQADVYAARDIIAKAAVVIMQLEVPADTIAYAIDLCRKLKVRTVLDPAPAPADGLQEALCKVSVLTPNQREAEMLLPSANNMGRMKRTKLVDAKQVASDLLAMGPDAVVLKLGAKGAMVLDGGLDNRSGSRPTGEIEQIPPFRTDVVDTTAAGDAFTAALAVAMSEGKPLRDAARFANAAGALACQSFGAQPSLPTREAVDRLITH